MSHSFYVYWYHLHQVSHSFYHQLDLLLSLVQFHTVIVSLDHNQLKGWPEFHFRWFGSHLFDTHSIIELKTFGSVCIVLVWLLLPNFFYVVVCVWNLKSCHHLLIYLFTFYLFLSITSLPSCPINNQLDSENNTKETKFTVKLTLMGAYTKVKAIRFHFETNHTSEFTHIKWKLYTHLNAFN